MIIRLDQIQYCRSDVYTSHHNFWLEWQTAFEIRQKSLSSTGWPNHTFWSSVVRILRVLIKSDLIKFVKMRSLDFWSSGKNLGLLGDRMTVISNAELRSRENSRLTPPPVTSGRYFKLFPSWAVNICIIPQCDVSNQKTIVVL